VWDRGNGNGVACLCDGIFQSAGYTFFGFDRVGVLGVSLYLSLSLPFLSPSRPGEFDCIMCVCECVLYRAPKKYGGGMERHCEPFFVLERRA